MRKRQYLGQHFLKSTKIARKIVESTDIKPSDVVLEIGSGKGILIPLLCEKAKRVLAYEKDPRIYAVLESKFKNLGNLELICGDGFKTKKKFTKFVSNLPYSKSRKAIEWIVQQKFSKAVIMVQREFGDKLFASDPKERKAISVVASYCLNIKKISNVDKSEFEPPPQISSIILEITKKNDLSADLIKTVNNIFSYRRKKISNILSRFGINSHDQERLDSLSSKEIISLAKRIQNKK